MRAAAKPLWRYTMSMGGAPVSFGCAPADGATTGAVLPARHTVLRQSRFHGPRGQIDVAPTRMRRA
jgi:hypothetical protein